MRNGHTARIERVRLDQLIIDPRIQRPIIPAHVKRIAESLDFNSLGVLMVSRRDNGDMVVLDGQQRRAALLQAGFDGRFSIQCEVLDGLSFADENAVFKRLNADRKSVLPLYLFNNRVNAGESAPVAISLIVKECGLSVATGGSNATGTIRATAALERVYGGYTLKKPQAAALRATLTVIKDAWGATSSSMQGQIIEGIGKLFIRDGSTLDAEALIKRLAKYPGGPNALIGDARGRSRYSAQSVTDSVAAIVVDIYNKGRRSSVLEGWRS